MIVKEAAQAASAAASAGDSIDLNRSSQVAAEGCCCPHSDSTRSAKSHCYFEC